MPKAEKSKKICENLRHLRLIFARAPAPDPSGHSRKIRNFVLCPILPGGTINFIQSDVGNRVGFTL